MRKSYSDLVAEAKQSLILTQPTDLRARLDAGEKPVIIDVREPQEWEGGVLPGAQMVPRGVLEGTVDNRVPRDAHIVVYCGGGGRSALAGRNLKEMGFEHVENLEGGFGGWSQAGLPTEKP